MSSDWFPASSMHLSWASVERQQELMMDRKDASGEETLINYDPSQLTPRPVMNPKSGSNSGATG